MAKTMLKKMLLLGIFRHLYLRHTTTSQIKKKRGVDLISNLPEEILQHILCFVPTKLAITTCLLSRRWRHVWCDIPSISLDADELTAYWINETLNLYTAPTTKSFHLRTTKRENIPHINRWIKCVMSHNVENLSLDFWRPCSGDTYKLPDFFYNSSSFKQLNVSLSYSHTIVPLECNVSWTSLQKLSLSSCSLSDEFMAKILSGCPVLENLTLYHCDGLKILDLRKSPRLRTLEVQRNVSASGPTQIVAPHIHYLRLLNSQLPCTFVDVASLTEAKLDICYVSKNPHLKADFLQIMVLKMLEKLQNTEKLTFGGNLIQILSLAEIRGVSFPMLKVKSLTLDTVIYQYVIPGIERLLQNSPDLEKLIVRGRDEPTIPEEYLDQYLKSQSLNPDLCWRSKDCFAWSKYCWNIKPKHVTSFVELVLENTKKLDKMVVLMDELYHKFKIEDVVVPRLSHYNSVTIVLSSTNKQMTSKEW